ncbi:hypothetical protein OUZ56_011848 [Daphnia magna]|uniref:Uncharacterized protein n=1 Tax=Daphnia magna TaxID=35525 RepID=A0ABQ9Z1B6_9CRUS|nr:hypothetical protein OUZ56_011848 [Daphnia magna]
MTNLKGEVPLAMAGCHWLQFTGRLLRGRMLKLIPEKTCNEKYSKPFQESLVVVLVSIRELAPPIAGGVSHFYSSRLQA